MHTTTTLIAAACMCLALTSLTAQQNVGIGTSSPTEKLEVGGIIYTNEGGVRFPDQTLQETAAYMSDPEDAGTPNGVVYLTLPTLLPDTMWLVDISQGGITIPSGGAAQPVNYILLKEFDQTSPRLLQYGAVATTIPKARLHFTNSLGEVYQTIELRAARVASVGTRNVYQGNGTYAHLEQLELRYTAIEIDHVGEGVCYCWSYLTNSACSCD